MMNKKKNIIVFISIFLVLLILLVLLAVYLLDRPAKTFDKEINNIKTESETIPYIDSFGTLYKGEKIISIYDICKKQGIDFGRMLCVYNNEVYFICFEDSSWCLNSLDLNTQSIVNHYTFENPAKPFNYYPNPNDYENSSAYCYGEKIIINDKSTVVEYDIKSNTANKLLCSEYSFPNSEITYNVIDNTTIEISTEQWTKTFTLDEMSKSSVGIAKINSFKDRLTSQKRSFIYNFFEERSVQYINGKIYVVGECLNYYGNAYSVFMEYDIDNDSWKYVTNVYTDDNGYCYILPEIK